MSLRASGFGHRNFTFGMERLLAAHRSERDGIVPGAAEQPDGHVNFPHISQPSDSNLISRETFLVGSQRGVVVHPGRQVTEVSGRQLLARDRLELHHVDGLLGSRDQVFALREAREHVIARRRASRSLTSPTSPVTIPKKPPMGWPQAVARTCGDCSSRQQLLACELLLLLAVERSHSWDKSLVLLEHLAILHHNQLAGFDHGYLGLSYRGEE